MGQGIGKPEADNVRRVEAALKGEQMQDDYGDECEGLKAKLAAAEARAERAEASREEAWGLAEQADKRAAAAEQRAERAEDALRREDEYLKSKHGLSFAEVGAMLARIMADLRGEAQP